MLRQIFQKQAKKGVFRHFLEKCGALPSKFVRMAHLEKIEVAQPKMDVVKLYQRGKGNLWKNLATTTDGRTITNIWPHRFSPKTNAAVKFYEKLY